MRSRTYSANEWPPPPAAEKHVGEIGCQIRALPARSCLATLTWRCEASQRAAGQDKHCVSLQRSLQQGAVVAASEGATPAPHRMCHGASSAFDAHRTGGAARVAKHRSRAQPTRPPWICESFTETPRHRKTVAAIMCPQNATCWDFSAAGGRGAACIRALLTHTLRLYSHGDRSQPFSYKK